MADHRSLVMQSMAIPVLSKAWAGLILLAAVPLYVRFLGVEAYGLVGLFTTAAAMLAVFDLGMPAWLTREFAGSPDKSELHRLSGLAHSIDWLAVTAVLTVTLLGGLFLQLKPPSMVQPSSGWAPLLGLLAIAIQWPGNLYAGMLAGQQRHATAALIIASCASLRVVITLVGLSISPTLMVFFAVQATVSALQTATLRTLAHRNLSSGSLFAWPDFNWVGSARGFASSMTLIGVLSLCLSQADKVLIGQTASLSEFGIYMLSWVLPSGLAMLAVAPLSSIALARLSDAAVISDDDRTWRAYAHLTSWMIMLIVPPAAVMALAPQTILSLWGVPSDIAAHAALILPWLAAGTAINGIMTIPYTLQVARGWLELPIKMNCLALAILVPTIALFAGSHGVEGAARGWLITNLVFALVWPYLMHRRLLVERMGEWLLRYVLLPAASGSIAVWAVLTLMQDSTSSRPIQAAILVAAWFIGVAAVMLSIPSTLRSSLLHIR